MMTTDRAVIEMLLVLTGDLPDYAAAVGAIVIGADALDLSNDRDLRGQLIAMREAPKEGLTA